MDLRWRTPVDSGIRVAPEDVILVADDGFLQKPVLSGHWDLRVYFHIEATEVLRRGTIRDQPGLGSAQPAAERYRTYYIPGEELCLAEVRPADRADVVVAVDNGDFDFPRVLRG